MNVNKVICRLFVHKLDWLRPMKLCLCWQSSIVHVLQRINYAFHNRRNGGKGTFYVAILHIEMREREHEMGGSTVTVLLSITIIICNDFHLIRIETQKFTKFCIVTLLLHLPKLRYIPHEFFHDKKSRGGFIRIYLDGSTIFSAKLKSKILICYVRFHTNKAVGIGFREDLCRILLMSIGAVLTLSVGG